MRSVAERLETSSDEVKIESIEVRGEPRRLGVVLNTRALEASLTDAFLALTREGIGTLLNGAKHRIVINKTSPLQALADLRDDQEKLLDATQKAMRLIAEKTSRGPGNLLVSNPVHTELCKMLSKRAIHWADVAFPEDKILVVYKGTHPFDAGLIWSPYYFEAEVVSTSSGRPPVMKMRTRHKLTFVDDNKVALVEIK